MAPPPAAALPAPPPPSAPPTAAPRPPVNAAPDFGLSGALAKDAASGAVVGGVVLKWSEPPDAAPPSGRARWRLHVFKAGVQQPGALPLSSQSAFLIGRDRAVADIPADHPSCSLQHAVIQFRAVRAEAQEAGPAAQAQRVVRPYIMDLESRNGTFLNGQRLPPARYVEMRHTDVLVCGLSTREMVLLDVEEAGGGGGA